MQLSLIFALFYYYFKYSSTSMPASRYSFNLFLKVLTVIPNISAAFVLLPDTSCKVLSINSCSTSAIVLPTALSTLCSSALYFASFASFSAFSSFIISFISSLGFDLKPAIVIPCRNKSFDVISVVFERTTALSIVCSSSLTLPGHS